MITVQHEYRYSASRQQVPGSTEFHPASDEDLGERAEQRTLYIHTGKVESALGKYFRTCPARTIVRAVRVLLSAPYGRYHPRRQVILICVLADSYTHGGVFRLCRYLLYDTYKDCITRLPAYGLVVPTVQTLHCTICQGSAVAVCVVKSDCKTITIAFAFAMDYDFYRNFVIDNLEALDFNRL